MRKIYIPITRPETIFTLILDHQDLRGWYRKNWNCSGLLCYKLKDIPKHLRQRIEQLQQEGIK